MLRYCSLHVPYAMVLCNVVKPLISKQLLRAISIACPVENIDKNDDEWILQATVGDDVRVTPSNPEIINMNRETSLKRYSGLNADDQGNEYCSGLVEAEPGLQSDG